MFRPFLQFVQDGDGNNSSMRLAFLMCVVVTLGLGTFTSIVHQSMMPLEPSYLGLITVLMGGKLFQNHQESNVGTPPPK